MEQTKTINWSKPEYKNNDYTLTITGSWGGKTQFEIDLPNEARQHNVLIRPRDNHGRPQYQFIATSGNLPALKCLAVKHLNLPK